MATIELNCCFCGKTFSRSLGFYDWCQSKGRRDVFCCPKCRYSEYDRRKRIKGKNLIIEFRSRLKLPEIEGFYSSDEICKKTGKSWDEIAAVMREVAGFRDSSNPREALSIRPYQTSGGETSALKSAYFHR